MHSIISAIKAQGKAGLGAKMQCPSAPGEAGLPRHFEECCQHSSAASRPSALFRNCPCGKQQQQSKAGPRPGQPTAGQQRGLSDYFLCNWKHLWRAFPEAHTGSAQASTKTKLQLSFSSSPTLLAAFLLLPQVLLPRALPHTPPECSSQSLLPRVSNELITSTLWEVRTVMTTAGRTGWTGEGRMQIGKGAGNSLFTCLSAGHMTVQMGKIHLIVYLENVYFLLCIL